ncbi:uncharacterized protein L3040_003081 [Drepanopeziza brunnea f. sp. 'multigermtubi']|uniref:Uncharacterized protein n=1 Tax=Marssonina brunnea f. sp. multigermtubi (strain MB_m1) TaxID=1072389 RepID=K1WJC9_MARBU|nr:uncharacterized protein MBM_09492 [Drepanopeziza brunnea f. sp. 'multigermtubi' MB_m1]EKD12317.1 hypothetical protein MBM_09492 [Drepanopeziza brunnea f. sp. 'multigermtubi' MB_m1]KAJ5047242.1 hypothetical protein L3040_003081 [Drepanopeziza brunnea f. sp. 'multigermtubi']
MPTPEEHQKALCDQLEKAGQDVKKRLGDVEVNLAQALERIRIQLGEIDDTYAAILRELDKLPVGEREDFYGLSLHEELRRDLEEVLAEALEAASAKWGLGYVEDRVVVLRKEGGDEKVHEEGMDEKVDGKMDGKMEGKAESESKVEVEVEKRLSDK